MPAVVVEGKWLISGGQPAGVFEEALRGWRGRVSVPSMPSHASQQGPAVANPELNAKVSGANFPKWLKTAFLFQRPFKPRCW